MSGVTANSLTLPAYTNFISESVNGTNYSFITTDSITVNTDRANNLVLFSGVEIKQGILVTYSYTVDSGTGTLAPTETIFTSIIDTPAPGYYWYILEILAYSQGDGAVVHPINVTSNLRSLTAQVVKQ